jgi:hypothetical protein
VRKSKNQKVVITIIDEEDGHLNVSVKFDPTITNDTKSNAVSLACDFLELVKKEASNQDA